MKLLFALALPALIAAQCNHDHDHGEHDHGAAKGAVPDSHATILLTLLQLVPACCSSGCLLSLCLLSSQPSHPLPTCPHFLSWGNLCLCRMPATARSKPANDKRSRCSYWTIYISVQRVLCGKGNCDLQLVYGFYFCIIFVLQGAVVVYRVRGGQHCLASGFI